MENHEEDESRAGLLPKLHLSVNEVAEVDDVTEDAKVNDEDDWKLPKCPPDCHEMNLECKNEFNHIEGECGCKSRYYYCEDRWGLNCPRYKRYIELSNAKNEVR
jgi:hypothetical protein